MFFHCLFCVIANIPVFQVCGGATPTRDTHTLNVTHETHIPFSHPHQ